MGRYKQFAVSTIKKTTSERPQGSRQVKAPARLGHCTSGTKGIDTYIRASTVPKLVMEIDDDDDKDDSDKMCAGNIPLDKQKCVLIPGLIRPGEVEEPRDIASNTADEAPVQAEGVVKATRPTAKSYFDVGQGSSSTKHSKGSASLPATVAPGTQDLVLEEVDINDQHLMKRKRVASNATSRKVPREEEVNITTVESSAVADVRLEVCYSTLLWSRGNINKNCSCLFRPTGAQRKPLSKWTHVLGIFCVTVKHSRQPFIISCREGRVHWLSGTSTVHLSPSSLLSQNLFVGRSLAPRSRLPQW